MSNKSGAFSELLTLIPARTMAASHDYAGKNRPAAAVGEFELDPDACELRRNSTRASLPEQPFRLLTE